MYYTASYNFQQMINWGKKITSARLALLEIYTENMEKFLTMSQVRLWTVFIVHFCAVLFLLLQRQKSGLTEH